MRADIGHSRVGKVPGKELTRPRARPGCAHLSSPRVTRIDPGNSPRRPRTCFVIAVLPSFCLGSAHSFGFLPVTPFGAKDEIHLQCVALCPHTPLCPRGCWPGQPARGKVQVPRTKHHRSGIRVQRNRRVHTVRLQVHVLHKGRLLKGALLEVVLLDGLSTLRGGGEPCSPREKWFRRARPGRLRKEHTL